MKKLNHHIPLYNRELQIRTAYQNKKHQKKLPKNLNNIQNTDIIEN